MYKIMNSAEGTEILLYSLIEGGLTAGKLVKALQASASDSITLRINSDGGEVFDAIAIYNYLKDKDVHVIIDGMCASAASIVAMSGKRITMKRGSMMMIHNPVTIAFGDSEDLKAQAEILDKVKDSIVGIYMLRTQLEKDTILAMMDSESWMGAAEAKTLGFADEVDEQPESNSEPSRPSEDFVDGVAAERQRMFALDELYTPARAAIINEAKYHTGRTAEQIAVELLKAETSRIRSEINNFSARSEHDEIDAFIDAVKRKRGR